MSKFITVEGGDGVGKTSAILTIAEVLNEAGHMTTVTREPGGTVNAEAIRKIFKAPKLTWGGKSEYLLIQAGRIDHIERHIKPSLLAGIYVIVDRYIDSTTAHQGARAEVDIGWITSMDTTLSQDIIVPDLTIIIDCPVSVSNERLVERGGEECRMDNETMEYKELVRDRFLAICMERRESKRNIVLVNGDTTKDEVAASVRRIVENFINNN